ncbi:MAG: MBL fold metallo-hydrolase [Simkaniaceae bacterium]|nr:MBL fold metallo-hydrolase [Simkaniaceae bacterium]
MKVKILGSGSSLGVPVIGCSCPVCSSKDTKNRRLRPSILLEDKGRRYLVDVGPDFRQQALIHGIDRIDGLLLTHVHYDHIAGIDDLRAFYFHGKKPIPVLCSIESYEELKVRYHYLIDQSTQVVNKDQKYAFTILEDEQGSGQFEGLSYEYMSYFQAGMKVSGFRFGDLAYVTDIRDFKEGIYKSLEGVKTLILSALRFEPSPVHFCIEEAIAFAKEVGAEMTYLVHIAHDLDHEKTNAMLPANVRLSYDGQVI